MLRFWLRIAIAVVAFPPVSALAGDVPLPVRKPKDSKGAAIVQPPVLKGTTAKEQTSIGEPQKSSAGNSSASPAGPAAKLPAASPPPAAATGKTVTNPSEPVAPAKDATADKPKEPVQWTAEEIEVQKARCAAILRGVDAVFIPEEPKREGACGAAAPVRLVSLGKSPQVALDPPALLTCDMVATMATWLKGDLQPLAKKHLGGEIVKIETMSDYSCRAAYGRVGNKLSEHGYANALDIRGFVTAKGEEAMVLEGWGTTQREIAAAKAAEEKKAAAIKAAAEKSAAEQAERAAKNPPPTQQATGSTAPASAAGGTTNSIPSRSTIVEGLPRGLLPPGLSIEGQNGLGLAPPQQLGGPKEKDKKDAKAKAESQPDKPSQAAVDPAPAGPAMKEPPGRISRFLHEAHASACRIFGTTLGPEANNAHRNHFHVDMAERRNGTKICD